MAKKKKKKKKKKLPKITTLKKKADKALSLYVRAITKMTYDICPLCKEKPIQCCFHFVSRRRVIIRWDIRNVVGACHTCNFIERKYPDLSRAWFIRTHGPQAYLDLVDESKESFTPSREFLQHIIEKYKEKLECLE